MAPQENNYQSLYRTWRPKTFTDMVGQEHVVRTLRQQVKTGHIAHAYLFSGSRGTGKTSAARILSMAINCLSPNDGDPCLNCEACQSLMSETTLDVFEMDAASNSRVEEIREMLEKVNYPPQFVRSKVYIIDEVHMLSNAAFNALLKTLEEPPQYMVFILATTEPQKLPATILSRCQRYDFGRLPEEAIIARLRQALKPQQHAEDAALRLIASAAEGSMRDAWSLMDMCLGAGDDLSEAAVRQALGTVDSGFMFDFVDALASRDAKNAYQLIDQLMRSGKDIQVFLKDISGHLRRLLASKLAPGSVQAVSDERLKRISEQAKRIPVSGLIWMLEKAVQAEGNLRWASQQRTVLEVFALSVCELSGEEEPLALVARIDQLEAQLKALDEGGFIQTRQSALKEEPPAEGPEIHDEPAPEALPVPEPQPEPVLEAEPAADQIPTPEAEPSPEEKTDNAPDRNYKQVWNAMLKAAEAAPSVSTVLNQGKFGGYADGCYRLQFPEGESLLIGMLMEEERRQQIEAWLTEAGGVPVRFEAVSENTKPRAISAKKKAEEDLETLSRVFGRQNIIVQGSDSP